MVLDRVILPPPLPREARSNIPLISFLIDPYQLESNSPANNSLSFSHLYAFLWVKYELTVHKSGVVHRFIHRSAELCTASARLLA